MGYIEQTDIGNVYVADINDWLASLSNLNSECKNYIDSEIRYKEILKEHDKRIEINTIKKCIDIVKEHEYCFAYKVKDYLEELLRRKINE